MDGGRCSEPEKTGNAMTVREKSTKNSRVDSNAGDVHANICKVASTREEIYLLFGAGASPSSDRAPSVRLTDRVILSPFAAKKLSIILERFLQKHKAAYGPLQDGDNPSTQADRQAKAAFLFQLVQDLDITVGYEQSLKITEKNIHEHRFLLGVNKKEIEFLAPERIIHICKRLDMPEPLIEIFGACLLDANYVHFGFEDKGDTCLYKVYVEFWDNIQETMRDDRNGSGPFLLHLGFKWNPFNPVHKSMTRYTWYPHLTFPEMLARASALLDSDRHRHLLETAGEIIHLAATRISYQDILYLEVTEDDNPRKSFDINVYRAGFQVGELYPLLAMLGQHYDVSHEAFHHLYDGVKTKIFGHFAGGVGREGDDFCTIYYGVEPMFGHPACDPVHDVGASASVPIGNSRSRQVAPFNPVEKTDADAARLFQMVVDLKVPSGFERSFKIMKKTLLPDRFLMGFERTGMGPDQQKSVLDICRQIDMPEDFHKRFRKDLQQANIVLFGFENNETKRFYKTYLEFNDRLKKAVEENPKAPHPFLMFTGYKWEVSNNARKVITRYTCFPALFLKDMAERVKSFFYGNKGGNPYRILEGILGLAANRAGPNTFRYFEADEAGTKRNSFSINLYRANLRVAELYPLLLEMVEHYDVHKEQFDRVYETAKTMILGNLAGGVDREGRDFLTLYYSDKGSSGKRQIA